MFMPFGGTYALTRTYAYVFRMLRVTGDPSLSMAVGMYQSLVGFVLVFTTNYIVKKSYPDGALF